jgi:hypothetical protein
VNETYDPTFSQPFDALGRSWKDISSEMYREYVFPAGAVVRIDSPSCLHVSDSGGHRIWDGGLSHYIPVGWVQLRWQPKIGAPKFVA